MEIRNTQGEGEGEVREGEGERVRGGEGEGRGKGEGKGEERNTLSIGRVFQFQKSILFKKPEDEYFACIII